MGRYTRQDLVDNTVRYFADAGEFNPSDTDIRLVSNDIGESFINQKLMTMGQWEMISQDKTVKMVRTALKRRK